MRTKSSTISTTIIGLLCICAIGICTDINNTSALTYQTKIDNSFRIERSVNVTLSSSDLVINDLVPGSVGSSNTTTLAVSTNNPTGYTVTSTVGDGDTYTDTDLKHKDSTVENTVDSFTSLATTDLISNIDDIEPGMWGYSFAIDNGSWSSYSGYGTGSTVELVSVGHNASSTIDFKIAASAKDTQAAGEYNNIINFITTVSPLPYMQDLNSTTIAALLPETHSTATVYDARDDQAYTIAKLKDGKYWMTTNLNLAGGTALSSSDTDVEDSYITSFATGNNLTKADDTIVLPVSSTSGFDTSNYSYIYNTGNTTNTCTSPGCYSYYSWDAATLGSGRDISTDSTDAPYSICPNGWKLPSAHSNVDSSSDSHTLAIAYGGSSSIPNYTTSTDPTGTTIYNEIGSGSVPNFLIAGSYYTGSFHYDGSWFDGGPYGRYWSATSYFTEGSARSIFFGSNYVYLNNPTNRRDGGSIRCMYKS